MTVPLRDAPSSLKLDSTSAAGGAALQVRSRPWREQYRSALTALLKNLFLLRGRDDSTRSFVQCLIVSLAALLVSSLLVKGSWSVPKNLSLWGMHSATSFEIAIHRVKYGLPSHVDQRVVDFHHSIASSPEGTDFPQLFSTLKGSVNGLVREDDDVGSVKALELPNRVDDSDEAYRRRLAPYKHNESSAVWLIEGILRVNPSATVHQVFIGLKLFRAACLGVFCFFLLRSGASVALATVLTCVAWGIQQHVDDLVSTFAYYSFLFPLLLASVGWLGLATSAMRRGGWISSVGWGLALGLWFGFVVNARTSYHPVVLALLLLAGGTLVRDLFDREKRSLGKLVSWSSGAAATVAAFLAFDQTFVRPVRELDSNHNAAHHLIGHNIVLSLAIPDNPLAKREGIIWSDFRGVALTRKVDPTVEYLGPTYEQAMLLYYVKLWLYHPGEMLDIYRRKLWVSGQSASAAVATQFAKGTYFHRLVNELHRPMRTLPNGAVFLLLNGSLFVALAVFGRSLIRIDLCVGACASLLVALLIQLESIAVLPTFVIYYHAFLMFWSIALGACLAQCAAQVAGAIIEALLRRRLGRRADSVQSTAKASASAA